MDKVEFSIESKKEIEILAGDKKIMVLPFIPQSSKLELSRRYAELMFANANLVDGYYQAEWSIIIGILNDCTSINVTEDNIDGIVSSGLWDIIKAKIENYQEFRNDLRLIIKNISDQMALEKSLGQVLDKVANKAIEFLDNIGKLDLSSDGIAKLTEQLSPIVKEIEKITGATQGVKKPKKKKEEGKAD